MKVFSYRLLLLLVSSVASIVIGGFIYSRFSSNRNILGESTHIVKVPKELLSFHHDPRLPGYYDLRPSHQYIDKTDWEPKTATYTLNSYGMNDAQNYTEQKPKGTLRVMTIGDSFTFGQFVNTEDSYPRRLSTLLTHNNCNDGKPIEVLNLGVPGYDIQYTVEHFMRVGQKFNPDIVIWLVNEHNVFQIKEKIASIAASLIQTTTEEEKLTYLNNKDYYWEMNKSMKIFLKQNGNERIFAEQTTFLNKFSTLYKGPLLVVMFSGADQATKDVLRRYAEKRSNSFFSANLPDLEALKATLPDTHPSIYCHSIIATYIYQQLNDHYLVRCSP